MTAADPSSSSTRVLMGKTKKREKEQIPESAGASVNDKPTSARWRAIGARAEETLSRDIGTTGGMIKVATRC